MAGRVGFECHVGPIWAAVRSGRDYGRVSERVKPYLWCTTGCSLDAPTGRG